MNVNNKIFDNLTNKILVSTPYMLEGIFDKSLIYIMSNTAEGAIGLIFNHLVSHLEIKSFFKISGEQVDSNVTMPVYLGGPIEYERGFFLHSDDYQENLLVKLQDHIAVSSNSKISYDIALGQGPKDSLFILGYTAWKAGQIEIEIKNNLWILADCNRELIFADHPEKKWYKVLHDLGIKKSHFITQTGNA